MLEHKHSYSHRRDMKMEERYEFTAIYSTERAILDLTGLFPRRTSTCTWKLLIHLSAAIFLTVTMLMAIDLSNIADIVEPSVFLVTEIGYIFKLFCLLLKGHFLLKIEDILKKTRMMKCSKEEKEMLNSELKGVINVAKLQRCFVVCYTTLNTFMVLYGSFQGKNRYLAYNWWNMFPLDVNLYFYGSVIFQWVTVTICGMGNSGIDIMCYKLSKIICCQMDIFIRRSRQLDYQTESSIIPQLKSLIQHHQEIIHLVQTLNDLFSPIALIQCISSGLAICFVGFQLVVALEPGSKEFITQSEYFCCMFVQIFFYCWYGQNIVLKSIEIGSSYYSTNWYSFHSTNVRKYLFLIMERTKRPLILRAGGVFPLSLSTLMSILRSSYSYMAVLRRLNKN